MDGLQMDFEWPSNFTLPFSPICPIIFFASFPSVRYSNSFVK